MENNNYNSIAWCYDLLSRIVFGNAIKKAQTKALNYVPANANILIAGGGTGWILEELSKKSPAGLTITYIDASLEMIKKSKKRNVGLNTIKFISQPVELVELGHKHYDVIITPFFLDNFTQEKCNIVFEQLHNSLQRGGLWLYTDFQLTNTEEYWQKMMLICMYIFFKIVCRLEAAWLPDVDELFLKECYKKVTDKTYYGGFIVSKIFQKMEL